MGIITSCIEVYKKEAYGLLLGIRSNGSYILRNSINYQSAERDYNKIVIEKHRENRINGSIGFLSNQKIIGDFHSHADSYERLSRTDKKDLIESKSNLASLLIIIRKTNKKTKWTNNGGRAISGSIGRNFFVKILAYKYDLKKKKIVKLNIKCPYIKKLNKNLRMII